MALSLYRKYRPNTFADVVGQEHVERTLVNAVAEGNVAHAYLFCGPRGTGKTTSARLLAKALLCEQGPTPEPDGTCGQCAEIAEGVHPDVYELDAASRTGVDNVREEIVSRVQFAPTRGRYKVYIIDEVHMLTVAAFNALLKTLEEPPGHVVFIMCTTDPHKVPETVQSRCQRFDFRRFSIDEIVGYLQRICAGEGFDVEPEALAFIAAKASGGMRDATTALEQIAVFTGGAVTLKAARGLLGQMDSAGLFELAGHIAGRDAAAALTWLDRVIAEGADLSAIAHDLAGHMRDLYVTLLTGGEDGIVNCPTSELVRYREQSQAFGGPERLARAMGVCDDLMRQLRTTADARLTFEMALVRLCRADSELTLEALAERIEALEQHDNSSARAVAAQPAAPAAGAEPDRLATSAVGDGSAKTENVAPAASASLVHESANSAPEPKPEPEPAAQTMSPARMMAAIHTLVKRQDEASGALLTGVELEQSSTGITLVFPPGSEFSVRLASTGAVHDLIAHAVAEVTGAATSFTCRIGAGSAQLGRSPQTSADFGAVTIQDAAAPASYVDDGYEAALEAFAESAYGEYDASASVGRHASAEPRRSVNAEAEVDSGRPAGSPGPADAGPTRASEPKPPFIPSAEDFAAAIDAAGPVGAQGVSEQDQELADMLSVFGDGINFVELD